ncbi:MAG: glycosyltransferase [Calditerrivibrio sp.]|nr:glycosyltransferase [Calditerrivibrio sp.]
MLKVDLHLHSKYSKKPTEWFLKRIGAAESYTEPEFLYNKLKDRGMDAVTITDHNTIRGCLKLKEKFPDDTFISVEATAHFPEDDCKVHILIYDINEDQFKEIDKLRYNIYDLREYLITSDIAHSVAHPIYSVNDRLTLEHLEKLLVLFNTFEGINACRGALYNEKFISIVTNLTKSDIEVLAEKHSIIPQGDNPHKKIITAGSDDHSGLMMAKAYTYSDTAKTISEFLIELKKGGVKYSGTSADFYTLAFNIYKIAYEYSQKNKTIYLAGGMIGQLIENISSTKKNGFWEEFKLRRLKKKSTIHRLFSDLIRELKEISEEDINRRFEVVFDKISEISDEFIRNIFKKLNKKGSSLDGIYKSFVAALPGIFMTIPFFSSFRISFKDHQLINDLCNRFRADNGKVKKIAWFTDTINDLNGVSVTIKALGVQAFRRNLPLIIYGSLNEDEFSNELPANYVNLPPIIDFKLPYYSHLKIKIPSIMKSLKIISDFAPDEIYISTPGPVGILGLIVGKVLNIKTIGIYHTDFTKEVFQISKDESLAQFVERYVNFFYNMVDIVKPTSEQYLSMLSKRGVTKCNGVFNRGVDTEIFRPIYNLSDSKSINLIYVGRISKDKNIDFLMEIYFELLNRFPENRLRLFLIGDGPYKDKAEHRYRHKHIYFVGKIKNKELPQYYSMGDLFVFPSNTDTFGMVVLEAQACALPAIVSDVGGPKEIIIDKVTGFVARANDLDDWVNKISTYIKWKIESNPKIDSMKYESFTNVKYKYDWEQVLRGIF